MVIVGATWSHPAVSVALQWAMLIADTVSENGSDAYSVCVLRSIDPTFACGSAMGTSATGAQPERCLALHVAPSITSISGWLRLPA